MSRGAVALLALASLIVPETAAAHGLGGIKQLPVPGWLFLVGGGTVLVVSFLALGVLWREPRLVVGSGRRLAEGLQVVLLSRSLSIVVRACAFALFAVVWSAAAFGSTRGSHNIAPTFVYVIFWVGMAVASALLGNVWSVLDPWRTGADAVAWLARRAGIVRRTRPYPAAAGVWPAVALLLGFTTLELVYVDRAEPRVIAMAILVYSLATWWGMFLFGRSDWRANGDGFAVYFGFLSRIAPVGTREREGRRELYLRQPFSELTRMESRPGTVVFLAAMLGTVAYDGFTSSTWWGNLEYDVETSFADPGTADWMVMAIRFGGMVIGVAFVATMFMLAVRAAEEIAGRRWQLAGVFVGSLIPLAFVYALSHYFSFLIVQGQFAIPLIFDPWDQGWSLLGSGDFQPRLDVLSPNDTWYVQVGALVVGHVVGLIVAHDRAVSVAPSPAVALRTQYVMLGLMVLYTVGGMWLLSIG